MMQILNDLAVSIVFALAVFGIMYYSIKALIYIYNKL